MPGGKIIYRSRMKNVIKDLKGVIKARPMYVRTREHITAHLDLAVISLIFLNLLKTLLKYNDLFLTDAKIQRELSGFTVAPVSLAEFIITELSNNIKAILNFFNSYEAQFKSIT